MSDKYNDDNIFKFGVFIGMANTLGNVITSLHSPSRQLINELKEIDTRLIHDDFMYDFAMEKFLFLDELLETFDINLYPQLAIFVEQYKLAKTASQYHLSDSIH